MLSTKSPSVLTKLVLIGAAGVSLMSAGGSGNRCSGWSDCVSACTSIGATWAECCMSYTDPSFSICCCAFSNPYSECTPWMYDPGDPNNPIGSCDAGEF